MINGPMLPSQFQTFLKSSIAAGLILAGSFAISLFGSDTTEARAAKCIRIYFDRTERPAEYWMGRTYATFTQNLLGHFPEWQQIVSAIELYQPGEIETCDATIYIGSYFENKIPQAFYDDFAKTQKNVAWLGYNIWKYSPQQLVELFGHEYESLTALDSTHKDAQGNPTFFRDVLYKGEVFQKFGETVKVDLSAWNSPEEFRASFEQVRLKRASRPQALRDLTVVAQTRHNGTGEVIPYILRKKNRFFVADVPFSFMHESDRMLVFADLLFDILNEKPRHNSRPAVVRIEDIHPKIPLHELEGILKVLREEQIPTTISLIPIFFDPLYRAERSDDEEFVTMDRDLAFMHVINRLKRENATFIWHGVTHQYGRQQNPHDGVSGSDFEFWDAINNRPIAEDSARWAIERLEDGWFTLQKAGISPTIWLTPHYQASPVDYAVFARVFPWNVGRTIYYNHRLTGLPSGVRESDLHFLPVRPQNAANRLKHLSGIQAQVEFDRWNGQMFPYEIYGDVHGQRLIPENLGNSQPYISPHVVRTRSARDIVEDARRNLVLRDVWGSFFYHSFLIGTIETGGRGTFPGDPSELRYILQELKRLGYQFVDLNAWTRQNTRPIRPEPIVRDTLTVPPGGIR